MRPCTSRTSNSTWTLAILILSASLIFGPPLTAQDRDAYGGVPDELTLRPGTTIVGELSQYLSSHQNRAGDGFTMTLTQPLVVNGWVVAREGQVVHGQVTVANKGGVGKGPSELGIELTDLVLVDGQQLPITTQLIESNGGSNTGRNVATVATTTGLGAALGGAVGAGKGAAIGAAAGAYAGLIGVLLTPGKPTVIPPESTLTFRLAAPATFSTQGSERAFLPVGPNDYNASRGRTQYAQAPPARRPYALPYPYPRVYAYPPPYVIAPRVTIVRPYRGPVFHHGRRR